MYIKSISTILLLNMVNICLAQNVGIGIAAPRNKLQVIGNLVVTEPTVTSPSTPTPAQFKTLINASTVVFTSMDSTGYIFDPGGGNGDYISNLSAAVFVEAQAGCLGFELDFQDMQLGTGDSVIIRESVSIVNPPSYAVGNVFSALEKVTVTGGSFYLIFKSNSDGSNGRGFSLLFKRKYADNTNPEAADHIGNSFLFNTKTGSTRAGLIDNSVKGLFSFASGNVSRATGKESVAMGYQAFASGIAAVALGFVPSATGNYSTALGYFNTASGTASTSCGSGNQATGNYSFATGLSNRASGSNSFVAGFGSEAWGQASTAIGYNNDAEGLYAVALGYNSVASGDRSFVAGSNAFATGNNALAIGNNVTASGTGSIALGNYVSTGGYSGAVVMGDNSTTTYLSAGGANTFRSRFVGGYALFSGLGPSAGAVLSAGSNSWAAISDVRVKENFVPVNGEVILSKIAALSLTTWNYIGQDKKIFRHYGPMAQDFYNAFGRDAIGEIGCDTLINQHDFISVNLIGVQALEKRTAEQKLAIDDLTMRLNALEQQNKKLLQTLVEKTEKMTRKGKDKQLRIKHQ